ncbi:MAG: hypothetical protein U0802_03055 [Candidatus Binatia bacterium]
MFVNRLRRKLEVDGAPRLLHTVRGAGYALGVERHDPLAAPAPGGIHPARAAAGVGGGGVLLAQVFGDRLLRDIDVALEEEATTVAALLRSRPAPTPCRCWWRTSPARPTSASASASPCGAATWSSPRRRPAPTRSCAATAPSCAWRAPTPATT